MKKILFLVAPVALTLTACGNKQGSSAPSTETEVVTSNRTETVANSAAAQKTAEGVVARITEIYDSMKSPQPILTDSVFCTKDWWAHYRHINEWDDKHQNPDFENMFFVEDDHWQTGYDDTFSVDSINVMKLEGDTAVVRFVVRQEDFSPEMFIALKWERGQWLVDDFFDPVFPASSTHKPYGVLAPEQKSMKLSIREFLAKHNDETFKDNKDRKR